MDARGDIGHVSQCQLLLSAYTSHRANNDQSGVNSQPYRQSDAFILLQTGIQDANCVDDFQPGMDCALCIILMRLGIAEVHEKSVTEVLRHVSLVALDDFRTPLLIRTDHFPVVFRIELGGKRGRANKVNERHGQLPTFGVRGMWCGGWKCNLRGVQCRGSRRVWCLAAEAEERVPWFRQFRLSRPTQRLFVHGQPFGFDNFVFEVCEIFVIEGEPALQGAI